MVDLVYRDVGAIALGRPFDFGLEGKHIEAGKILESEEYLYHNVNHLRISRVHFKASWSSSTTFGPSSTSAVIPALARRLLTVGGRINIRGSTSIIKSILHRISFAVFRQSVEERPPA
jgi:hypothetical protein